MRGRLSIAHVVAAVGVLCSAACGITPALAAGIDFAANQVSPAGVEYALVKITPEATRIITEFGPRGFAGTFTDRRPPPEIKFGIGDIVSVTVFEAAAGGLFIPIEAGVRPGNFVTLPEQPVDTAGNISVPYAGPFPRRAGRHRKCSRASSMPSRTGQSSRRLSSP